MTTTPTPTSKPLTPNYGIDAPAVLRNLFLAGFACLACAIFMPAQLHVGSVVLAPRTFYWPAGFLLAEACLYLFYVKVGKLRHRDRMLSLVPWRGDEQVLDVGCGRGLLLIGGAKKLTTGHATGIDLWSNVDMGGNSSEATMRNLEIEGVTARCTILSVAAQEMTFPDGHFDVIVSNLCLHNIYDKPTRQAALAQIVRVLKPGGTALISDYKLTGEYARFFREAGLDVTTRRGGFLSTFPPLNVVIARKPV
jgi:arsenite methyltransferase